MGGAICRVTIRGRVQGVGYRAWVEHQARAHGLDGWVRNKAMAALKRCLQDRSMSSLI